MITKVSLSNCTDDDLKRFMHNVADCAVYDHQENNKCKSGNELLHLFASDWRNGHRRFATGIYNNVRWSLELSNRSN